MSLNNFVENYPKYSQYIILSTGLIILVSLIAVLGFRLNDYWVNFFTIVTDIMLSFFILNEIVKLVISDNFKQHIRDRWFEFIIIGLLLFQLVFPVNSRNIFETILPNINPAKITLVYIVILEIMLLFLLFLKVVRVTYKFSTFKIHSSGLLALSFLAIILLGSFLLYLPRAYIEGANYSYLDALFTSTSAVCVTGLTVVDTQTHFTIIGKVFILILIQIGGLGIMTLTTFFAIYLTGGVSLRTRTLIKDLISEESIGEIQSLIKSILVYTIVIETIGTIILYLSVVDNIMIYEPGKLYHSLFHSVSAFCNAGFSVFSDNLMNESIKNNYIYSSTIMLLVVLGGLGFMVHSNLYEYYIKKKINRAFRLKVHTKLVLYSSGILIVTGTVLIYFFGSFYNFKDLTFGEQVFQSLFWSVTSRTAGFNIYSMDSLNPASTLVVILLMWIGASPGSTGGGIKTTTLTVVSIALFKFLKGRERIEIFKREVARDSIRQAFLVILASILVLGLSATLLVWMEPSKEPMDLIFEAASAISTVGLSKNITFNLGDGAKFLIIIIMFIGRIGVLAFLMSFHKPIEEPNYKFPKENILVG